MNKAAPFLVLTALLLAVTSCRSVPKGIEPVQSFESERYLGTWYEIARLDHFFERNMTHVTATYIAREDGHIGVVNRGYDARRERWRDVAGVAKFRGKEDVAALKVTFQWPISGAYNVIALDHQDYQWAVVCGPSRGYLWILAKQPSLPGPLVDELVATARENGFRVDELIWVEQNDPPEDRTEK